MNYQKIYDRENIILQEKDVIDILVNWTDSKGDNDLRHLTQIVTPDLDLQEFFDIKGLYVGTNILREKYGFNKEEKPGDFDIVIIPYSEDKIHFERTGVCEVKVVRPTRKKPQKNSNSLGTTQLKGLIDDGFPFIGLIHISMTEPLLDKEKLEIDHITLKVGDNTKIPKGKTLEDFKAKVKLDHFQWFSADKQIRRLISLDLPKYAAILCFGLTKLKGEEFMLETVSRKLQPFQSGYFNPNVKEKTIENVRMHFLKNQTEYLNKVLRK